MHAAAYRRSKEEIFSHYVSCLFVVTTGDDMNEIIITVVVALQHLPLSMCRIASKYTTLVRNETVYGQL